MKGWLDGCVALISGGGSGIGRAVAGAFVDEGAAVGVLERDEEKCTALAELGDRLVVIQGDATSAEDNARAVRRTVEAFGGLDTLATFVGVFDHYTPLLEIPDDRLDDAFAEIFEMNVKSVLLAVRAAEPHLRSRRGSIVITCSSSSFYPGRGGPLYVATKFALRGLVLQLGHELAPEIRVNGVAPGGTLRTDLRGLGSLGLAEDALNDRPGRAESQRQRTPLQVAMEGDDHAGAYVYLASGRARGVSGEIIRSDGGMALK